MTSPPTSSRRSVLNWFLGTSLGAMCVAVFYPVVRYLIPPEVPEAESLRVVAAQEGELQPNQAKIFRFGSRPGILVRTQSGEYRAFAATCTHLNCTVQYREDMERIWCACHNGIFDLNGDNVGGPPPRPLESYEVNIAAGEVIVSKG